MQPSSSRAAAKKNPSLLKSFSVPEELLPNIEDILTNCTKLVHLRVGHIIHDISDEGLIWDGNCSINDGPLEMDSDDEDSEDSSSEEEAEFELDPKVIASNSRELRSLRIGSGLELRRQPNAPPTLDQLLRLDTLSLCPISDRKLRDQTRDEWNLRVLAQSSEVLKNLDLRGCNLKILSLGWLTTKVLTSLHLFYQVPAASVIDRWSCTLRYITLARMRPSAGSAELDACLSCLAMADDSKLEQLDLRESDCSLAPLKQLVAKCRRLNYLDTRGCRSLPDELQARFVGATEISEKFTQTFS